MMIEVQLIRLLWKPFGQVILSWLLAFDFFFILFFLFLHFLPSTKLHCKQQYYGTAGQLSVCKAGIFWDITGGKGHGVPELTLHREGARIRMNQIDNFI